MFIDTDMQDQSTVTHVKIENLSISPVQLLGLYGSKFASENGDGASQTRPSHEQIVVARYRKRLSELHDSTTAMLATNTRNNKKY